MTDAQFEALAVLAYAYLQHDKPDKAASLLGGLDVLRPNEPQTLRALAAARLRLGRPAEALDVLDRLAMLGAVDAAFQLLRAQALAALERRAEATAAFAAFIDLKRDTEPVA